MVGKEKSGLTGKCKQDFEAWLDGQTFPLVKGELTAYDWNDVFDLEHMPVSMQFGVIQEWADSVGINVNVYKAVYYKYGFHYAVGRRVKGSRSYAPLPNRESAQLAAIEKLNEIYNER